jgi:predicted XRE-type DNA-binding protein
MRPQLARSTTWDTSSTKYSEAGSRRTLSPCHRSARASKKSGSGMIKEPIGSFIRHGWPTRCTSCTHFRKRRRPPRSKTSTSRRTIRSADEGNPMSRAKVESFASVWDAIADTAEEAANLRVRSELMSKLAAIVERNHWTQAEAASRCRVAQPRINDLLRGRISRFSIDALVNLAAALGQRVHIDLAAHVRRSGKKMAPQRSRGRGVPRRKRAIAVKVARQSPGGKKNANPPR